MNKLTRYEVEPNSLTLTIRMEDGKEITVVIDEDFNRVADALAGDIYRVNHEEPDNEHGYIRKVTSTITYDVPPDPSKIYSPSTEFTVVTVYEDDFIEDE